MTEPPAHWRDKYVWLARLAPLGTKSSDGRVLSANGTWQLVRGRLAPVRLLTSGDSITIGYVTTVYRSTSEIFAAGVIRGEFVERVVSDDLQPQLEIGDVVLESASFGQTVFSNGAVSGVVLGKTPAFNGVWISVGGRV